MGIGMVESWAGSLLRGGLAVVNSGFNMVLEAHGLQGLRLVSIRAGIVLFVRSR